MMKRLKTIFASILSAIFFLTSGPLANAFEINQYLFSKPALPVSQQKVVYFIHDIHAQKEAQRSIASLIKDIRAKAKIGFIGLEGYEGSVDLTSLRQFPHEAVKEAVADFYLEKNKITGPIYGAVLSKDQLPPILGMENSGSYVKHVKAYKSAEPYMTLMKTRLTNYQNRLIQQESSLLSPELKKYQTGLRLYRDGTRSLHDHLINLMALPAPVPSTIQRYEKVLALETRLDMGKVEGEKNRFLAQLTRGLDGKNQNILLVKSQQLKEGKVSNGEFFHFLSSLARAQKIDLANFPSLSRYMTYTQELDGLDTDKLSDVLSAYERQVGESLIKTAAERRLVEQERFANVALHLVNFTLTPSDFAEYQSLKPKYAESWAPLLQLFENFYTVAHERDGTLSGNVLKALKATNSESGIVVVGGFHFEGMEKHLTKKGIRVVSVFPSISVEMLTESSPTYLKELSIQKSLLERVLSGAVWTLGANPTLGVNQMPLAMVATNAPGGHVSLRTAVGVTTVQSVVNRDGSRLIIQSLEFIFIPAVSLFSAIVTRSNQARKNLFRVLRRIVLPVYMTLSMLWSVRVVRFGVGTSAAMIPLFLIPACTVPAAASTEIPGGNPAEFSIQDQDMIQNSQFRDGWSEDINLPQLEAFVQYALDHNLRLKINSNVDASKALAKQAGVAALPSINDVMQWMSTRDVGPGRPTNSVGVGVGASYQWNYFMPVQEALYAATEDVRFAEYRDAANKQDLIVQAVNVYLELNSIELQIKIYQRYRDRLETLLSLLQKPGVPLSDALDRTREAIADINIKLNALVSRKTELIRSILGVTLGTVPTFQLGDIQNLIPGFNIGQDVTVPQLKSAPVPGKVFERLPEIQAAQAFYNASRHRVVQAVGNQWPLLTFTSGLSVDQILGKIAGQVLDPTKIFTATVDLSGTIGKLIGNESWQVDLAVNNEGTAALLLIELKLVILMRAGQLTDELTRLSAELVARGKKLQIREGIISRQDAAVRNRAVDFARYVDDVINSLNQALELEGVKLEASRTYVQLQAVFGAQFFKPKEEAAASTGTTPEGTTTTEGQPSRGGSLSKNLFYIQNLASFETLGLFLVTFSTVLIQSYFTFLPNNSFLSSITLWSIFPLLFQFSHLVGERYLGGSSFKDPHVVYLTKMKWAIALLGIGLTSFISNPLIPFLVVSPLVIALTVVHQRIQDGIINSIATELTQWKPDLLERFNEDVDRGRLARDVTIIQSAMQEDSVAEQVNDFESVQPIPTKVLGRNLFTVLIDSQFTGDVGQFVRHILASDMNPQLKIRFVVQNSEVQQQVQQEIARDKRAEVLMNSNIFDVSGEATSVSLLNLEGYLLGQGLLDSNPTIRIFAREGLAINTDGLTRQSKLQEALIILLNSNMVMVPFSVGNLDAIMNQAKLVAKQA